MVLVVKNLPANSGDIGDAGLIPGPGRSTGAQRLSEFTFLLRLLRPSLEGALRIHPIERVPEAFVNRASPVQGLYWLSV